MEINFIAIPYCDQLIAESYCSILKRAESLSCLQSTGGWCLLELHVYIGDHRQHWWVTVCGSGVYLRACTHYFFTNKLKKNKTPTFSKKFYEKYYCACIMGKTGGNQFQQTTTNYNWVSHLPLSICQECNGHIHFRVKPASHLYPPSPALFALSSTGE